MVDVLLAGNNWRLRALLRAQLIEERVRVEAHETVADFGKPPRHAHPKAQFPKLMIADLSASANLQAELELVSAWHKYVPVWIVRAPGGPTAEDFKARGFEKVLSRPLDMKELVESIVERVRR